MTLTVIAITGRRVEEHARAIETTLDALPSRIDAVGKLVAPYRPPNWDHLYERGMQFQSSMEWTQYLMSRMYAHVSTDFGMLVQWDGYGRNPDNWNDRFLDYDYIGAPWSWGMLLRRPWWGLNSCRVGNGGFSIRSRKWMGLMSRANAWHPLAMRAEDLYLCRHQHKTWKRFGLRVAPPVLASEFSFEHPTAWTPYARLSFGFHGAHNLEPTSPVGMITHP